MPGVVGHGISPILPAWPLGVGQYGGRAFTPLVLGASLLAWWTADRADLITLSGAQITSWKDVTHAYDAVQGVAGSRPLYSATSWNGFPGVTCDGVDDELTLVPHPFPINADPSEIWVLAQQDADAADTGVRRIAAYGNALATSRYLERDVSSGVNRGRVTISGTVSRETTVNLSSRHVMRDIFSATDISAVVDGAASVAGAVVPATVSSRFRIGAGTSTAATGFHNGKLRDVLVTGPLSVAQAAQLATYLANRRAL